MQSSTMVGVFGAEAHALVIYALIAHCTHDARKCASNLLVLNCRIC